MGYNNVKSDEFLILSETKFWLAQEEVYEVVLQVSTDDVLLLCVLYSTFI